MNFFEKSRYVAKLPVEKKIWLLVFTLGSLVAWLAIRFVAMRRLSSLMGHHLDNRTVCIPVKTQHSLVALQMGQLMSMVANNTPWPCKCLSQVLCVKWLLNRYKISAVVHLGAKIAPLNNSNMQAHAWINVGKHTIVGGPQHKLYRVVATFTSPNLT